MAIVNHAGSVVRTIQAIGRIWPPMQLGRRSLVCYFDTGFVRGDKDDLDRNLLLLQSVLNESEERKQLAKSQFANLFQSSGLDLVFNSNGGCLRRDLLSQIDVDSPPCGMCSKCNLHNHVAVAAHSANDQQLKEKVS